MTWLNNETLRFVYDLILLYYHTIDIKLYRLFDRHTLADTAKIYKQNFRSGRTELSLYMYAWARASVCMGTAFA